MSAAFIFSKRLCLGPGDDYGDDVKSQEIVCSSAAMKQKWPEGLQLTGTVMSQTTVTSPGRALLGLSHHLVHILLQCHHQQQ